MDGCRALAGHGVRFNTDFDASLVGFYVVHTVYTDLWNNDDFERRFKVKKTNHDARSRPIRV